MAVIPKNAQVVVRRVPASGGGRRPPAAGPGGSGSGRSYVRPFVPSSSGLPGAASAGGNEEERSIRAMMQATSSHWEQNQQEMPLQQAGPRRQFRPSNYGRGMPNAIPPDTYVCFRCGQKGMSTLKEDPSRLIRYRPLHTKLPHQLRPKLRSSQGPSNNGHPAEFPQTSDNDGSAN